VGRHITSGGSNRGVTTRHRGTLIQGSLLEILVVTAILGIVSAVMVVGVSGIHQRTSKAACDADVAAVALAAQAYSARHGGLPLSADDLHREGYLRAPIARDHTVVYARDSSPGGFIVTGRTSSGTECRSASG
jgi:type II secretory pathway pseudopilin PulG